MPLSLQRQKRRWTVFHLPYSGGRSLHGCSRSQNPEHAIQKLTGILCVPSPRSLVSYCVRLENFPHRIGHIVPSIAVLHEETPLCVFLHYTTKRHFCRQCLGGAYTGRPPLRQPAGRNGRTPDFLSTGPVQDAAPLPCRVHGAAGVDDRPGNVEQMVLPLLAVRFCVYAHIMIQVTIYGLGYSKGVQREYPSCLKSPHL